VAVQHQSAERRDDLSDPRAAPAVQSVDVVILGAGPAGLACAIAVRRQAALGVLVVDSGPPERERPGESAPPQLLDAIRRLGLDERFLAGGHCTYPGNISLWGAAQPACKDAIFSPAGAPWRLDRPRFDALLAEAATARGAALAWHTRYSGSEAIDDGRAGYRLRLADRATGALRDVHARFVIDASGPSARFARDRGACRIVDDRLHALACFAPIAPGAMTMQAAVEATEHGWWYAARLPRDRAVVLHVVDKPVWQALWVDGCAGWDAALASTSLIRGLLPAAPPASRQYHAFPIYSSRLDRTCGRGWLATGDAASTYDPIVAQGLYKALSDGLRAGQRAAAALSGSAADTGYGDRLRARYAEYFAHRRALYDQERRWPHAPFWRDRHERRATDHAR
jgi:flavin-dependent dehydrogenase